jgi:hypothetical protein
MTSGCRVNLPWQRRLRLLQALWREQQQLPIGRHPRDGNESRPLGSRIAVPRLTLEEVVASLQLVDGREWVDQFHGRYLAYSKAKHA